MPFVTADRMRERPAEERASMGKVDISYVEVWARRHSSGPRVLEELT